VLGYILSNILWRLVDSEDVRWKKMFRKIPFNIIITNKGFKNYLVKECNHLLNSE